MCMNRQSIASNKRFLDRANAKDEFLDDSRRWIEIFFGNLLLLLVQVEVLLQYLDKSIRETLLLHQNPPCSQLDFTL